MCWRPPCHHPSCVVYRNTFGIWSLWYRSPKLVEPAISRLRTSYTLCPKLLPLPLMRHTIPPPGFVFRSILYNLRNPFIENRFLRFGHCNWLPLWNELDKMYRVLRVILFLILRWTHPAAVHFEKKQVFDCQEGQIVELDLRQWCSCWWYIWWL